MLIAFPNPQRRQSPSERRGAKRAGDAKAPPGNGAQGTIGKRTGMILGRETDDVNDHYVFHNVRALPRPAGSQTRPKMFLSMPSHPHRLTRDPSPTLPTPTGAR